MKRPSRGLAAVAATSGALIALAGITPAHAAPSVHAHANRVCADANGQTASCNAQVLVDDATGKPVNPLVSASGALSPTDLLSAYNLAGTSSGGRTVAIVDAYGYANAESDLAAYRAHFGLSACTTASGCLTIINQNGGTSQPAANESWAQEQALDLDAVSATCPDCKIVLVQANSASMADLGAAANQAAKIPGVVAISNSYGGGDSADTTYGAYYNHPGIAVTASTGDKGYQGSSYPSSSQYVVAVGGTTLKPAATTTRGWSETAWSSAGSGCSRVNPAIQGQTYAMTGCNNRASADVSADADPNTGIMVYGPSNGVPTWMQFGGTSLASPIIASVFALSGRTSGYPAALYSAPKSGFYDITVGANGRCKNVCKAQVGWDGPTGLGTPNGTTSF